MLMAVDLLRDSFHCWELSGYWNGIVCVILENISERCVVVVRLGWMEILHKAQRSSKCEQIRMFSCQAIPSDGNNNCKDTLN